MQKIVQIYHLTETDDEQIAWCLDENSKSYCVRTPLVFSVLVEAVKVTNPVKATINSFSQNITLTPEIFKRFIAEEKHASYRYLGITDVKEETLTDIYFYQCGFRKTYVRVFFKSKSGFQKFRNLFQGKFDEGEEEEEREDEENENEEQTKSKKRFNEVVVEEPEEEKHRNVMLITEGLYARFRVLESQIPAYWHWMHHHGVRAASTIKIPADAQIISDRMPMRISKADFEVKATTIKCAEKEIVTQPKILSWDIEALSKIPTKFPNPCVLQDVVFFISAYISTTGRKVGIYLIDSIESLGITEARLADGTEIIVVNTEGELLDEFWKLIQEEKPHVLLGYNTMGFDSRYLHYKMELYHKKYPNLSLMKDEETKIKQFTWSSSAYKHVECWYYETPGMLVLDLFVEIRRSDNLKSYTLDAVSEHFLKEHKVDLKAREMFDIYLAYQAGDRSQVTKDGLRKIAEYGIQDSVLPVRLFNHRAQWVTYVQMSCIMGVGIMDLTTRGQTLRTKSNIYRMCREQGFVINVPQDKPTYFGKFKGAYVCDMTVGLHDNVIVYDFASLYPSIISAFNLCYSTFIHRRDWSKVPEGAYNSFIVELPNGSTQEVRYIKKEIFRGILPRVVEGFLKARADTRAVLKRTTDEIMKQILDKKQLAIKVSNNSVYGASSSDFAGTEKSTGRNADICSSSLGLKWVGMTVTAIGQKLIKGCAEFCRSKYGATSIYGDTDSTFFKLPPAQNGESSLTLWEFAAKIADEFNATLPPPLTIELEKIIKMVGLTRKKYIYRCYNNKAVLGEKINFKGVVATRRDTCKWQAELFAKVGEELLKGTSKDEVRKIVYESMVNLMRERIPIKKLLIGISIAETYKSNSCPQARLKNRMAELGRPIVGGSRIEYLIVQREVTDENNNIIKYMSPYTLGARGGVKEDNVATRMRMPDEIIPGFTKIDYAYYISNKAQTPIDQLYAAAFHGDKIIEPLIKGLRTNPQTTVKEMEMVLSMNHSDDC